MIDEPQATEGGLRRYLRVVWVSVEGNPARYDKATRALRARYLAIFPLVFYFCAIANLLLRASGFHARELLGRTPDNYLLLGGIIVAGLWMTRGFDNSPLSDAVRQSIRKESREERQDRRRAVILYFVGSLAALASVALFAS